MDVNGREREREWWRGGRDKLNKQDGERERVCVCVCVVFCEQDMKISM